MDNPTRIGIGGLGVAVITAILPVLFPDLPKIYWEIGVAVGALTAIWGFVPLFRPSFWKETSKTKSEVPKNSPKVDTVLDINLPFGSLKLADATMRVANRKSINETLVQMYFDLENSSDQDIEYKAKLSGDANGISPDPKEVAIQGWILKHNKTRLIYSDIAPLKLVNPPTISQPVLVGRLSYSVEYGPHGKSTYERMSSKTLQFTLLSVNPNSSVGDVVRMPTTVKYLEEREH